MVVTLSVLLATFLAVAVVIWFVYKSYWKPLNYPPGPGGLFSFFILTKSNEPFIAKAITSLSEKFGPVIGLRVLHRYFVCFSGYEAVSEALSNPLLNNRPDSFDFNARTRFVNRGVLMTHGNLWKEQRRFTIRQLKDFGLGKTSQQDLMLDEVNDLMASFQEAAETSSDGNILLDDNTFTVAVLNILWAVVAGKRFKRTDPQMSRLVWCMNGFMRRSNGAPSRLSYLPFLRHLAPELTGFNSLMEFVSPIYNYLKNEVAEHKRSREPGDSRDFIDAYLDVMATSEDQDPKSSYYNEEQLVGICFDVLVAGSETTSHTLGFALVLMITHPDVQSRVQKEIDQVLLGRPPCLADRGRLPYTEATLLEIQRLGTVAPITVPHVAEEDTSVRGFYIPKGATTLINIWSVHMDPDYWTDPEQFRPERHLNKERSDHILSFGLGKRSCIGESLARNTLFLFFVAMMQRFRFHLPAEPLNDPSLQPSMEPIPGLTLSPRPCLARIVDRNQ